MPIILQCRDVSGSVAFRAGHIEGLPVPERRYTIAEHIVMLDGYDDYILRHDTAVLLAQPDGLYRMPTPQEQDALVAQAQAAVTVAESTVLTAQDGLAAQAALLDSGSVPSKGKSKQSDANGG